MEWLNWPVGFTIVGVAWAFVALYRKGPFITINTDGWTTINTDGWTTIKEREPEASVEQRRTAKKRK